jgi:solute carrier family 50 protein (sugar transporter)
MEVRRTQKIGSLNPYPFVITIVNCIGWIMYGCMTHNIFIAIANMAGLAAYMFYCMSTLLYLTKYERENIEVIMLAGLVFWSTLGIIVSQSVFGSDAAGYTSSCLFIGYVGCVFGIAFYAGGKLHISVNLIGHNGNIFCVGLTKMWEIVRDRDSSSIHVPSAVINTINAALWTLYALASLNDPNVYIPNGIGLILSILQLIFAGIFPRKKATLALVPQSAAATSNPLQEGEESKL